ncbi:MAG: transcriptional repressor [Saprospiraceae bacterium]|nr:transcriptional repressor [Saprospiraceae bacterium]
MKEKIIHLLRNHELRITQTRQDVLAIFIRAGKHALTSGDIELELEDIDRITLYRTLKTFEESGLVHAAIDHTGKQKYALCADCDTHHHSDDHPHFHCTKCDQTTCLESVTIPQIEVPQGYHLKDLQVILSGICSSCSN